MSIKMRVFYHPKKSKLLNIANLIKNEYDLSFNAIDIIPPAYSCDKERIVILILSINDEPANELRLFCEQINKQSAQNIAIIMDGKHSTAQAMKDILTKAGTNVIDEVLFIKCGLFGTVKDEEKVAISEWLKKVVTSLQ